MSLLIGLQAPLLGFCQHSQTFFVSEHHCEPAEDECDHQHHHRDHHHEHEEPAPEPNPCDDSHEFISLDVDDFLWSATSSSPELKFPTIAPFFSANDFLAAPHRNIELKKIPRPPPPPGEPLFRLQAVWRL